MAKGFKHGAGGGNTIGATLTVTAPSEGITVTITKDDIIKAKVTNSDGVAVFKGLSTGEWTVTITNGTQTTTETITITADYDTALTFFAATINVTYPEGATCTATDGITTLTAPDTTGTWVCVVPNAGDWTISCTENSSTATDSVSITTAGETYSITLSYTLYLINGADYCTRVTGGWNSVGKQSNSNSNSTTPSSSLGTDCVVFKARGGDSSSSVYGFMNYTAKKIDLTNYNTLILNGTTGGVKLAVWSSIGTYISTNAVAAAKDVRSLSVSGLSGSYYVGFYGEVGGGKTKTTTIYSMYFE